VPDPVEEAAGRLYGLPLEDFTRERDATARELRKAKDREAADAIAKLPKPSQGSWAANTLAREQRKLVKALLKAGDALRAAQESAVAGKGGAAALRDAAAAERAAVDELVETAKELKPAGRKPTAQTLERLRTTLHAAATDDEVREALDKGRLVDDATGAGAWGLMEGWDVPAVQPRERRKAAPKKAASRGRAARGDADSTKQAERERKEREAAQAAEAEAAERERRQRLEAELREARAERRSRERELDRAEKSAERAARRLETALAAAEDAREQAEEAKSDLDAAREAAEEARDHAARLEEQLD
jgi:hypothetical protein